MTKVCTKCLIEKELELFNKQAAGKCGRRSTCRECQNAEHAKYRQSEHGNRVRLAWKKTDKGKESEARYRQGEACRESRRKREATSEYKEKKSLSTDKRRFGGNKKAVLERDGYRCVLCHSTDKLQVHHIDKHGRNTPTELQNHNVDNLITLCAVCHIKQHNPVLVRWGYVEGGDCNECTLT